MNQYDYNYDIDPREVINSLTMDWLPMDAQALIAEYSLDDEDREAGEVPVERAAAFVELLKYCRANPMEIASAKLAYETIFWDAFDQDCEEAVIATLIIANSVYCKTIDPIGIIDEYIRDKFYIEDWAMEQMAPYLRQTKIESLGL